jgi:hypothetical protein
VNEIKDDHFVDVDEESEEATESAEIEAESSNKKSETRNASLSMFRDNGGVLSSLPGFGWVQSCRWTASTIGKRAKKEWDEALMRTGDYPSVKKAAAGTSAFAAMLVMIGLSMAQVGVYADPVSGQISLPAAQAVMLFSGLSIGTVWTLFSDHCTRIRNESPVDLIKATVGNPLA